ncbi:MAG: hypothetical protein J6J18_11960 [Oscillospiraceae bacterium]|nr:hypothetical protein [Oscillospiraceae bacterium]
MIIIIQIDDPGDIIGIKEIVASRLEDLGGVRVVEVREDEVRQESLWKEYKP